MTQKYKISLDEQKCLQFQTNHPDGDKYLGIITHLQPRFVVLREVNDFELDGVLILPKRFIKNVRDGEFEECYNQILKWNGVLKDWQAPTWLQSTNSIGQVLQEMKRREIWPGVEIIDKTTNEASFYIGPITKVGKSKFDLYCYDAAGNWEALYELNINEIVRIEFNSKYCNHFNSFMRSRKSPNHAMHTDSHPPDSSM